MNARMLSLWVAYAIMLLAIFLAVHRTDELLGEIKDQNCALAGLEIITMQLLLLPDTPVDDDLEATFAEIVDGFSQLCD